MRTPVYLKKFNKDLERCKKRQLDIEELKTLLKILINGEKLPPKYKNHPLSGDYVNCWDCHIQPDWLLIYTLDNKANTITFLRTGTHSDLF